MACVAFPFKSLRRIPPYVYRNSVQPDVWIAVIEEHNYQIH